MLCWVASAQLTFETNSGAITITGFTGTPTEVVIPSATNGYPVTGISDRAFQDCYSLRSITIPNSITNLGQSVFYYCTNLADLTMGTNVTGIGQVDFYNCSRLGSVAIPNSVTSIGSAAFDRCYGMTNISLGSSVTNIGSDAFALCSSLTNVTIPKGVTGIGIAAFSGCFDLKAINVEAGNSAYSSVGGVLFDFGQTTLVECPGGVVGSYNVPDGVKIIGVQAFANCTNVSSVAIANSVTNVGIGAFQFCYNLANVSIGTNVISIGSGAFYYCRSLANVTIPASVTALGPLPFEYCTSLTAINVDALNPNYSSAGGVLLDRSQSTIIEFPGGLAGNYMVPSSVTSIEGYSCYGCMKVASITIPSSVTNIGEWAFAVCYDLTSVYFAGNAPDAGADIFAYDSPTVYYLPATAGWSPTFGGVPAILWNPQVQTSDGSFGFGTNGFGFNITGSSNLVIVVEASTNLGNGVWLPVSTNTLITFVGTNGMSYFSDPLWTNCPSRFYRLSSP